MQKYDNDRTVLLLLLLLCDVCGNRPTCSHTTLNGPGLKWKETNVGASIRNRDRFGNLVRRVRVDSVSQEASTYL